MRVIIVDDHALIRTGLATTLQRQYPTADIKEAENSRSALAILAQSHVELAIVDLFIPGEDSFAFVRQLCDSYPAMTVAVLSATENPAHIRKCIDLGASGFIPKSSPPAQLLAALADVLAGKIYLPRTVNFAMPAAIAANGAVSPGFTRDQVVSSLTPRQLEILQLLARGQSNKQIAKCCQLSENTIKVHVSAILRALGLNNRSQAGILMQQLNDAAPPPE